MQTARWLTSVRWVGATTAALLVGACSGDTPQLTDPLDAPVTMSDIIVTTWSVNLCKVMEGGGTANFTVGATSGTVLIANPAIPGAAPDAVPTCQKVWEGAPGAPVTVTLTELQSPSYELVEVRYRGQGTAPGITVNGYTVTLNEQYMALGANSGEAFIVFKNEPRTPPPSLQVSKTAAGRFEIPVRWELVKSVTPTSHDGVAGGVAGSSNWTVSATRIEGAATNHVVTGNIVITNPAGGVSQTFTVTDVVGGVAATVNCPTNTVAAGATVTCTYSAAVAGATTNTAVVKSPGFPDQTATASVSYTSTFTGDQSVTLADPRFGYSTSISSSTTVTFPETFRCPSDPSFYTNGSYTRTEVNTATLTGPNTNLSRNASVLITCVPPPPPSGGQGCTPGYWKQSQHFDSWTGYTTTQLFSAVFGVGPSVSLLTALQTGGGGANALGRHAVAALLNTANSGVSYDMTTAGVIALVQSAYASGNFEAAHLRLAGFNEQGCPLN